MAFEYSIPVTDVQINDWATVGGALGTTSFFLEPSLVSNADFISNCAALLPNGTDGISQVQVILEYSYAVVNYAIKNSTNQTVSSGTLTGSTTTDTLPPANYTVMYTTTDHAGLSAMTSYALTVRDSVKPKAICQPTYIFQMSPSGGMPDTLKPFQINNGSYDNCTPTSNLLYSVSPNVFDCHQAGTSVNVTLTVTDTSGNFSTCKTIVGLKDKPPSPAYTPVCENGILQLFAESSFRIAIRLCMEWSKQLFQRYDQPGGEPERHG